MCSVLMYFIVKPDAYWVHLESVKFRSSWNRSGEAYMYYVQFEKKS